VIVSVKPPPVLKKRVLTTRQLLKPNFQLGHQAENKALQYLLRQGLILVAQNIMARGAEVDLVMWDQVNQEVVFVEVKWRSSNTFGSPVQAVNQLKLNKMQRLAALFLAEKGWEDTFYRFDVVSITAQNITWIPNVTW
jgi:putative endonuclease